MAKNNASLPQRFSVGSLYQWALLGFIIVTIPLMFVIIYAVTEVGNYTQKSQQTLFQAVITTENNRMILERLTSMERSIRQFQVLNEAELFDSYLEHRDSFLDVLELLKSANFNEKLTFKLQTLEHNEKVLYRSIFAQTNSKAFELTETDLTIFDQLTTQARSLLTEGEKKVGAEAASLAIISERVRKRLVYFAVASIPLALFLGFIFVYLLTRPIKNIGTAIRNLGEIGFEQPIAIRGPKDLTDLGVHLEWLRQRLNQLEHEKQQFIRNVSHELKTPLATLKEGTDLLAEDVVGELNTEQQKIIKLMKMGNTTINNLVENLLEYQRTISTQIDLNVSDFSLGTLIKRVSREYQLLLRSKNITLRHELRTTNIRADYDKLKIVVSNLLSNALKFSPQNGTIRLHLDGTGNAVELSVEDQGPGIPEDVQPFIFDDFYQGDSSHAWKIKGSGLGLALVNHYVNAHQGVIKLLPATKEFCGARFVIYIPKSQGCKQCDS